MDVSELIAFASTMGLTHGGQITVNSGRVVNVADLTGYTMINVAYETHRLIKLEKTADTIEIPANGSYYVYYTASGVLSTSVTLPSNRTNIILGRVVTNSTDVLYIEKSELDAHHWSNYVDRMLREALGPVFATGGLVSENTTPLKLNISSGVYFYGEHRLTLASATAAVFDAYYRDGAGGSVRVSAQDTVPVNYYDDGSGTLVSIPSGKWVKHLVYAIKEQTGTQKFLLVYGQNYHDTTGQAEAAALPVAPSFVLNTFVKLASVVVQQGGSAIASIIDERPRLGFVSSSVAGSVSDHGDLVGLDDDDHTQYLLANGARPVQGDIDFDEYSITNIGTVNSIVVQSHGSRHAGNGADAVPSATTSVSGLMSASDKVKLDGIENGATANQTDAYLLSRSNHTGSQTASTISDFNSSAINAVVVQTITNGDTTHAASGSVVYTALAGKEPTVPSGTSAQYYRGDKSWATLNAAAIPDFTTAVQAVTIDASKIDGGTVSNAEFATLDGITTGVSIQSQIDGKQATVTGAASSITTSNLTASRALASDSSGKVAVSSTTASELGFVSGVTSGIQSQLDGKQPTITGAATTITSSNLTASRAVVSDSSGKVAISATTATEVGYLSGVTSSVQTQISSKANLSGGNTFTGKQIMTPSATDPGLNLGSIATDPSAPANGDVWYNSTSGDVKIRQNGVTIVERNILAKQVLTSGTTYTPTAGAKYIEAILIGGGGGGGGVTGAATSVGAAGGGGSGAILSIYTALTGAASYTVAIGAFGAGGAAGNNNGTAGTSTTLTIGATTYTAAAGSGGSAQTAGTAAAVVLGGAGAAAPTGGTLNVPGTSGGWAYRASGTVGVGAKGADSQYGAGGAAITASGAGSAATGYGAGGGGAFSSTNQNRAGGNGAPGAIIITEYA